DAKATEILDKVKSGSSLADAADHLKVETLTGLKRGHAAGPLSATAVDTVFRTAKDAAGRANAEQPGEQVIFRVTDIVVPPLDLRPADTKRMLEPLNRSLSDDLLGEYISGLESEVGVTINQSALTQAVGGGSGEDN